MVKLLLLLVLTGLGSFICVCIVEGMLREFQPSTHADIRFLGIWMVERYFITAHAFEEYLPKWAAHTLCWLLVGWTGAVFGLAWSQTVEREEEQEDAKLKLV